ncbi:MAG: OmpA family protein [Enhygromyxa sp.]
MATLGLALSLTACGPIAFQDTVNFKAPEPEVEAPPPERVHAKIEGDHIVIDEMIQFEFDSAEIKAESHEILDDVVKVMQENPQIELDIIGHTSSEGSAKHNNKLSSDRAASVMQYLAGHGIDAARMVSHGKGPSEPIADNSTEEGRIANRRVEFKITNMPAAGEGKTGGVRARPGQ